MTLDSPTLMVPGVGPAVSKALKSHGIETVGDILRTTPLRWIDYTHVTPIRGISIGTTVVICATVDKVANERTARKYMAIVRATLSDTTGSVDAVWFNQPYLSQTLRVGTVLRLRGVVGYNRASGKLLQNPTICKDDSKLVAPVYSERTGIASGRFSQLISHVSYLVNDIPDPLSREMLDQFRLLSLGDALKALHFPTSLGMVTAGLKRLAVDELWSIMVLTRLSKIQLKHNNAPVIMQNQARFRQFIEKFDFKMTSAQTKALSEILSDMAQKMPMRRLLNGDVGSGKTVVAFAAADAVLANHLSVVLLSPTTVLAEQHYQSWYKLNMEVDSFLFTAGLILHNGQKISRAQALKALHASKVAFISGTHSLLQGDIIQNRNVGLVIVDEQHRFGVAQRAATLGQQHLTPHLLSMSATPIPRTAALTLYGDLDVSYIKDKPHGRQSVITKLASERSRPMVERFVNQIIDRGEQVFVVCPAIETVEETSDQLFMTDDKKAVKKEFDRLTTVFPHRRIGLLHGKLRQAEKEQVLSQFRDGQLDILVTTSVIEVGVDISQASAIIIEGAEHFGLASLHQLRGRVGRGLNQAYCFLFADKWNETTKKRLQLLVDHSNGFILAEKDLLMRGPGDLFGTLQAGIAPFHYASLSDGQLVETAEQICQAILKLDRKYWPATLTNWIESKLENISRE